MQLHDMASGAGCDAPAVPDISGCESMAGRAIDTTNDPCKQSALAECTNHAAADIESIQMVSSIPFCTEFTEQTLLTCCQGAETPVTTPFSQSWLDNADATLVRRWSESCGALF